MNLRLLGYGFTILLGAFLLFLVQPLLARCILPWFGGSPDTWATCMFFYQVMLLGGYLYALALTRWIEFRFQPVVHTAILLAAMLFLPIMPSPEWKPEDPQDPVWRIVRVLTATVGLPYFALSATTPLLQGWIARGEPGSPYRFYALSNLGSLLALLSYPVVIEPAFRLTQQVLMWSAGFVVFGAACIAGGLAFRARIASLGPAGDTIGREGIPESAGMPAPGGLSIFMWVSLSACGSVMLLAATNQISQDVAVVPLLWIVPLTLYLLTFIICFAGDRWYRRALFTPVFLAMALVAFYVIQRGAAVSFLVQIAVYCGAMFAACMVCHGELARSRPHARHLAVFYAALAAGGALGGVFVALAAPRMFGMLVEYETGLVLCACLLLVAYYRECARLPAGRRPRMKWPAIYLVVVMLASVALLLVRGHELMAEHGKGKKNISARLETAPGRVLARARNFYGTLAVCDSRRDGVSCRSLTHGRIVHGQQFHDKPASLAPITYYGPKTALAVALEQHPRRMPEKTERGTFSIGNVGMGVGTLAAYGRPGDHIVFYEINPDIVRLARQYFTYLSDTPAKVDVVMGDGRLSLERDLKQRNPQKFDVLVVDAFNGDAVPMHLLTRECFGIYWKHMKKDGIMAFHVSGRYLDLTPLVGALCRELGLKVFWKNSPAEPEAGTLRALWVLASRNEEFLAAVKANPEFNEYTGGASDIVWTDDYGSLLSVLRR